MTEIVSSTRSFRGTLRVPGDKSISHRALMLAGLAKGASRISGIATGKDVASTAGCLRALGVEVERLDPAGTSVAGVGLAGLKEPAADLDAGNSGTTLRLLSGILAGQGFTSRIGGDVYLNRRPMKRIIEPLERMGARVECAAGGLPPLAITGGNLRGIEYRLPVASAQVKSCVLLAGLFAAGRTTVIEDIPSRDHTERMLALFGVKLERDGSAVSLEPGAKLLACELTVPGDPSSAAFFAAAAALIPGGGVILENICLNPTRAAFFDVLEGMGARVERRNRRSEAGEPVADVVVGHGELKASNVGGSILPSLIDEVPVLAVLAACAQGKSEIRDAAELRVKETDRLKAVALNLARMGAKVTELPDGLRIEGPARLAGCTIDSYGDHRIAMAFSVAALAAEGETVIGDSACADISFPGFYVKLRELAGSQS